VTDHFVIIWLSILTGFLSFYVLTMGSSLDAIRSRLGVLEKLSQDRPDKNAAPV
jgi:hypothetical protein